MKPLSLLLLLAIGVSAIPQTAQARCVGGEHNHLCVHHGIGRTPNPTGGVTTQGLHTELSWDSNADLDLSGKLPDGAGPFTLASPPLYPGLTPEPTAPFQNSANQSVHLNRNRVEFNNGQALAAKGGDTNGFIGSNPRLVNRGEFFECLKASGSCEIISVTGTNLSEGIYAGQGHNYHYYDPADARPNDPFGGTQTANANYTLEMYYVGDDYILVAPDHTDVTAIVGSLSQRYEVTPILEGKLIRTEAGDHALGVQLIDASGLNAINSDAILHNRPDTELADQATTYDVIEVPLAVYSQTTQSAALSASVNVQPEPYGIQTDFGTATPNTLPHIIAPEYDRGMHSNGLLLAAADATFIPEQTLNYSTTPEIQFGHILEQALSDFHDEQVSQSFVVNEVEIASANSTPYVYGQNYSPVPNQIYWTPNTNVYHITTYEDHGFDYDGQCNIRGRIQVNTICGPSYRYYETDVSEALENLDMQYTDRKHVRDRLVDQDIDYSELSATELDDIDSISDTNFFANLNEAKELAAFIAEDPQLAAKFLREEAIAVGIPEDVVLEVLSLGVDMVPVLGTAKGAAQTGTGKDLFTGQDINRFWEGFFTGAAALTGGAAQPLIKGTQKAKSLARLAKHMKVFKDNFSQILRNSVGKFAVATNKRLSSSNAFYFIKDYRSSRNIVDSYGGQGVVSVTEISGKKIYGINGANISEAERDVGRYWVDRVGLTPGKENFERKAFFDAEANTLMRLYAETSGKMPINVNLYVDKIACSSCQSVLPKIIQEMGVKKLTIKIPDGRIAIVTKDGFFGDWQ